MSTTATMTSVKNRLVSMLMAVLMVFSCAVAFVPTAEAATSSSGTRTQTITVETKSNWWKWGSESITLSQAKGTRKTKKFNLFKWRYEEKTTNSYGTWQISVKSTDGRDNYTTKLTGGSKKLSLKGDKTYTITVSWDSTSDLIYSLDKGSFTSYPTWRVKSANKATYW